MSRDVEARLPWSVARWDGISLALAVLGCLPISVPFVLLIIFGGLVTPDDKLRGMVIAILGLFAAGLGVASAIAGFISNVRKEKEDAAGYTTRYRSGKDLIQVVPGTDRVVRAAGDPYLGFDEYRKILADTPNRQPIAFALQGKLGLRNMAALGSGMAVLYLAAAILPILFISDSKVVAVAVLLETGLVGTIGVLAALRLK